MASIYKYYKERLIEISGRNRSLFSKKVGNKFSYDIGKIINYDFDEIQTFTEFLWKNKRHSYALVSKEHKERLYRTLKIEDKVAKLAKEKEAVKNLGKGDKTSDKMDGLKRERLRKEETKKAFEAQINALKYLKREIEEFAKESGRNELFVGYPFVEGSIGREMVIKAPLILFPVKINVENENTVNLELRNDEPIQLNKVFALAYAKHYKLNLDDMNMEFNNLLDYKLKDIESVVNYMRSFGFKMGYSSRKGMFDFTKGGEPKLGDSLEVKHYCVIGRFPLANSIYNDYNVLEKNRLTTDAINELLESRTSKKIKKPNTKLYTVNQLDFAQENAIERLNQYGNMVIYGPPGTGKSQTIVNIITDALCKNKSVLVVSQKKAALDVVYNRLGTLNSKAMYINDAEKNKNVFYEKIKNSHKELENFSDIDFDARQRTVEADINKEIQILENISNTLFTPTAFGISLQEMYANSYIIGKTGLENTIYKNMIANPNLMRLDYHELSDVIRVIKEKRKADLYYKQIEAGRTNPLITYIKDDLEIHHINSAKNFISKLLSKRRIIPLDLSKYPNSRQLLSFYLENGLENSDGLSSVISAIAKLDNQALNKSLKASYIFFPAYPFFKYKMNQKEKQIRHNFDEALEKVKNHISEYSLLARVLDRKGYYITIDNILNGNSLYLRLLLEALNNYVEVRDMNINVKAMTDKEKLILNFAYEHSENHKDFKQIIDKLLVTRIYHELVMAEDSLKNQLSQIMDFENIRNRIISLKNDQNQLVRDICSNRFKQQYKDLYYKDPENKNFLYQVSKQQGLWPIRKLMEHYQQLLFKLFPCWLLSPESVSTIMPLRKELFDLIIFDEASQIFIESTLPTIYRGRHIVIAGDNKQLRPTATFVRRYMGNDNDEFDLSTQAALEVESLLDLATSRYNSANLTYHYRSKNEELINFSNYAFYDCQLQVAPNTTKNRGAKPIERVKVNGRWIGRHNTEEAKKVVDLLKKIFSSRKNRETIGIITFNTEQEEYIEDLIDEECNRNPNFRKAYLKETNRRENGEDVSIFIKNLENVQGDERDIIIFSIGYARNEYDKVVSQFGPLNLEGGENRLNVAITRAKQKIYVVTSIEPEELNVDGTKNAGPKIFKKYLQYVRAVSAGNAREAGYLLQGFRQSDSIKHSVTQKGIEHEIKEALEKLGYIVETNLGNTNYKLTLAVYDKMLDRYLVGIECDYSAFQSSESVMERDVFHQKFLESRGWTIIRVWSRDWWLGKNKVISQIVKAAEKTRESLGASRPQTPVKAKAEVPLKKTTTLSGKNKPTVKKTVSQSKKNVAPGKKKPPKAKV